MVALLETIPQWVDVSFQGDGERWEFELRLSQPLVLSTIASLSGSLETAVIEAGDYWMTFHVAPGAHVRQVIDAMESAYERVSLPRPPGLPGRPSSPCNCSNATAQS
jgi:hypothetical protein